MLGPSGHFSQRSVKEGIMSLLFGSYDEQATDPTRFSPPIKKQREDFNFKEDQPEFMGYFRMFGSDLSFITLTDLKDAADAVLAEYMTITDFIFGRHDSTPFEISRNVMLHDGDYDIQTASGLPFNLKLSATAAGKLSGTARLNIGGLFSATSGVSVEGDISPSFAVQVAATFKVDLGRCVHGLFLRLHAAFLHATQRLLVVSKREIRQDEGQSPAG